MKSKTKKLLLIPAVLLLAAAAVAFHFYRLLTGPVTSGNDFNVYVYPDSKASDIYDQIIEADSAAELRGLKLWLRYREYDTHVRSGCYTVGSMASAQTVAAILDGGMQTPVNLTVRSRRKTGQIAHDIAGQLMLDSAQVAGLLDDPQWLDSVGYSPATVFCMIIPETYQVYWNISPQALMDRLIKERERFWNDDRRQKAADLGLDDVQVTTLASIIEEETAMADELPMVAGLYLNRLKIGMPLQADPTVIFALGGERPKRVLREHLQVESPYNTYKVKGLPPAPIRFVNPRSIDAVLNHAEHKYLYMCAKEDFSGYHNFATSYSQHKSNAVRYQRALNQRGIH